MSNAADGYLGDWLPHKAKCGCADCQLEKANERIAALQQQLSVMVPLTKYDEDMAAKDKEIERIKDMLTDSSAVHTGILTGQISLSKEKAIHVAGLPADIEQRLAEAERTIERLRETLEGLWMRHGDGSDEGAWAEWDTVQEIIAALESDAALAQCPYCTTTNVAPLGAWLNREPTGLERMKA